MIDLHTHTLLSDGLLIPSELIRRADAMGIQVIAITDHVDSSNIEKVVPQIVEVCEKIKGCLNTRVIAGAEVTHAPLPLIPELVKRCRELGAKIVAGHGETIMEPVLPGSNKAFIESGVDILAHPGLITEEDVQRAVDMGVYLEISGRKGHSFTNGHVVKLAERMGARMVLNSDAHAPGDLMSREMAEKIIRGSGAGDIKKIFNNSVEITQKIL